MTAELRAELLDAIRSARACMADIRALAEKLGDRSQGQIEATLQGFLDTGKTGRSAGCCRSARSTK